MSSELKKVAHKAEKRGIPNAKRHIFFCGNSGCCKDKDEAKAAGKILARASKAARGTDEAFEFSPVECLNLCSQGPLAVVYPEGVWYAHVDEDAAEKIVEEHLQGGRIVEELVFARSAVNSDEKGD